ncbi:tryptophan-rich protein [Plasmodium brasilianum]|uniref:Tryptophan-rich antigen, putative n=2 Tax=Plasmodium (Plasmodium) TaxID=418103 RepID=A0A1A8X3L6_PLAMA|nr:tryptophan-rich protein [Plasmodium malariae]KAI4838585.1 tryptophan-rich protein [Plasmodium brasilianum]SBS98347.1 tryptophan-rich antigen, putative [Plasmodium malariae]SCN12995.1 tryptophan-rich protein [Plasmodium malariae]
MKPIFLCSLASFAMFKLSSSCTPCNCDGILTGKTVPPLCKFYQHRDEIPKIYLKKKIEEFQASENIENYEWKKWFSKEKKNILNSFKNKAKEWNKYINKEFDNFLENLEKKWMHYNPNMHEEYGTYVLEVSSDWSDEKWTKWFKLYASNHLKEHYEEWFNKVVTDYHVMMTDKLNAYSMIKKNEYESRYKNSNESAYWMRWLENQRKLADPDYYIKENKFRLWKQRKQKQYEEWTKLINYVNGKYVSYNNPDLKQWCEENDTFFKGWLVSFFKRWVTNKQWTVWLREKKKYEKRMNTST